MRRSTRRSLRALVLLFLTPLVSVTTGMGAATTTVATAPSAARVPDDTQRSRAVSSQDRRMRRGLHNLAETWAIGGGSFGYPFWNKAAERWRSGEISASLFREYVTGYRDRLTIGCSLLDDVDVEGDVSADVRDLVLEACHERVEGLRAQQAWLDESIRRATRPAELELEESDARLAELDAEMHERFEMSWRNTRLAMNRAQSELDTRGLDRLPEDAFI